MTRQPWHKHYHEDALNGMASMPVDLRGAYYTLLDLMYDRRGALTESDRMLAARMCCSVRKWLSYRDALIQAGKIQINSDGHLTNERFEKELKISRKLAENGAKGGRARTGSEKQHNKNKADAEKGLKQTPKPQNQIPEERDKSLSRAGASETVEKIWALLPKRKRDGTSKAKLLKPVSRLLKAGKDPSQILIAVSRCYSQPRHVEEDGQYAPAVYSWLADGVWENWLPEADRVAEQTVGDDEWRRLLLAYHESQSWPAYAGEAPGHPDCRVPALILERFIAWSAEQRRAA